jgi:rSAM/selenodomain-associated transferase 2
MSLSVVIPTLDEAAALPSLLEDLRELGVAPDQVVVADAGSRDDTVAVAAAAGTRVIRAPRGRARQLNAGARSSRGEWLLFLHADSRVGADARDAVRQVLAGMLPVQAAVFRFAIDLPPVWRRLIEAGQVIRERWFGLSYGDQGLLVRRECFEAVGGFPELSLMEDVVMIRRLRRRFGVARLPAAVVTSGRRYRQRGVLRTGLAHVLLITLFAAGVSPARLIRWRDGAAALPR